MNVKVQVQKLEDGRYAIIFDDENEIIGKKLTKQQLTALATKIHSILHEED